MKLFKPLMRLMITAGSVGGFVAGWALLAQAPNPKDTGLQPAAQAAAQIELPRLEPVPSLGGEFDDFRRLPSLPQPRASFQPRFRTGGS